jgi:hypothetical protein
MGGGSPPPQEAPPPAAMPAIIANAETKSGAGNKANVRGLSPNQGVASNPLGNPSGASSMLGG